MFGRMFSRRARHGSPRRANHRRLRAERLEDRQLLTGVVAGVKWNDLDADHFRDAGEPGLGGVQIYADTSANGKFDVGEPMCLTAADGTYQLPLAPGTHTIRETVPSGWVQMAPTGGSYPFLIHEGETLTGRDFGNRLISNVVTGTKWNDLDGNRLRDEGEPGLGGWQIYADLNSNSQFDSGEPMVLTAGDGTYELPLAPGDYTIRETVLPDWEQTFPVGGSHAFTLALGETLTGRDFGNRMITSGVAGVKWEDPDGDGSQDPGERGLADWQIYADLNGNRQFDAGEPMTLTAGDGSYTLLLTPGDYTVRETLVPGWQQTWPVAGSYPAAVAVGVIESGYDFGNQPVGWVTGIKWHDLDQDHLRDAGEPGLANWQIYADLNDNQQFDSGEPMTLTAGDGSYEMILAPGDYHLRETLVSGWTQTTPAVGFHAITIAQGQRLTGRDFGNWMVISGVAGVKWEDSDGDSIRDSGERGLADWQIYADLNGNRQFDPGEPMTLTAGDGSYTLLWAPGAYTIRETLAPDWQQTWPVAGSYPAVVAEGVIESGYDFGNRPVGSVTGIKWHDLDQDHVRDAGEPGLANWQIYADLNDNQQFDSGEPMTLTAGDGSYEMILAPGDYHLRETLVSGWTQTTPAVGFHAITIAQGQRLTGRDFGNWMISPGVTGVKWEDLDGDRVRDSGELGLADWQIYADLNGNSQFDPGEPMTLTAGDGSYTLLLAPGAYTIRETLAPGWQQTWPIAGAYPATVAVGVIESGFDFGNQPVGSVSGIKWHDLDLDHLRDAEELGLADWQIYADLNDNQRFDAGEPTTLTAGDGTYELVLPPGAYHLRETLVSGWVQTTPVDGSYSFTIAQGQRLTGRDFGNWRRPSGVTGVKWEDLDGDHVRDSGELGLADWQIYADLNGNSQFDPGEPMALTAGDGSYTLELEPNDYTIRETLVPGWRQTWPLAGSYPATVAVGVVAPGYDFGNQFIVGKATGVKWNDLDADGLRDVGEPGLADWQIYADLNNNSRYDSGEPMTLTTGDGSYELELAAGNYIVRETLVSGWFQTAPPDGFYPVSVGPGETVAGCDFGNVDGLVTGLVWDDANGNGLRETGESGLTGWRLYADISENGQFDTWEPTTVSTADGSYALPLSDGTYMLREVVASGWRQTCPPGGSYAITIVQGVTLGGRDFGNQAAGTVYDASTPSLYDPDSSVWYLRGSASTGAADYVFGYGQPGAGWLPVAGDWDGNGTDSIGLYDPQSSLWYLRDANSAGQADYVFGYGPAKAGWIPVVGDWDGNGTRTVGLYDSGASTWYLRNSNQGGAAEIVFGFGQPGADWIPVVGDWDGNGTESIGLYDPSASTWYLRNANSTAAPDALFGYGQPGAGWTPVAGDWNASAGDSIGLVDAQCVWSLRDSNSSGTAEVIFGYGQPEAGWIPVTGDWGGAGAALLAAAPATVVRASDLGLEQLQPVVAEAVRHYAAAGLGSNELAALATARVVVADLPGAMLGWATRDAIWLDANAAGHGWFIDRTPAADEEFAALGDDRLQAIDPSAVDRIDLVSVVEHELGHVAGFRDLDAGEGLMSGRLGVGLRRTVGAKLAAACPLAIE